MYRTKYVIRMYCMLKALCDLIYYCVECQYSRVTDPAIVLFHINYQGTIARVQVYNSLGR